MRRSVTLTLGIALASAGVLVGTPALLFPTAGAALTSPDKADVTRVRLQDLFEFLDEHRLFQGAALVVVEDETVYAGAYGMANQEWRIPNTLDTRYRIASLSKQFAAVIVLQLADEGLFSIDDPVGAYLDGLPEAWSQRVTVQHLLNQTSGIPNYTLLPEYTEVLSKKRFTRDEFYEIICSDSLFSALHFAPGESWEYSNTNYFLLGVLAERLAGVPYEDLVQRRIFVPMEMRDSGVFDSLNIIQRIATGYEVTPEDSLEKAPHTEVSPKSVPSGGLYSTVLDLQKWCHALDDGRLLSPAMMEVFTTPTLDLGGGLGYSCGNWREFREIPDGGSVEIFAHGGSTAGISTWLLRVPARKRYVVLLHNGGMGREGTLEKISKVVLDVLDGKDAQLPPLDLIGPLANTYFTHRESLVDHYRLLKERHAGIYDFRPEALSQIAQILIGMVGDHETALILLRLNVDEYPDSPLVHADLGGVLLKLGSEEEALRELLIARKLKAEPDEELEELIKRAAKGSGISPQ